jgi:hypothetical protein
MRTLPPFTETKRPTPVDVAADKQALSQLSAEQRKNFKLLKQDYKEDRTR